MKRIAVWAAMFAICGIYFRLGRSEWVCLVFFLFMLLSLSYFVIKTKNWKYGILLLMTLSGFFMAGHSTERQTAEIFLSERVEGTGVIREAGKTSAGNQKLRVFCDLVDESGETLSDVDLYIIWSGEGVFHAGDKVFFTGELTPFYRTSIPGGYDEELYLKTKGYDGKMYPDSMEYLGEDYSLLSSLTRARAKVQDTLEQILPEGESGMMKAMLTGEKDDIPDDYYTLYVRAGVVHILCISGLHMSILALYVSFFMEKILKRSRRVSAAVTMAAALAFLAFVGFTPSAVRAVTMISVVMLARICFRSHDRLNEIAIAALLILCIEPLYLFHIGFQLSFITVLGLCLAAEQIDEKRKKEKTWKDWLKESLLFSLYASLCSFPLVAYYFYGISLVGILANLVIIPLSGLLLGFGILAAVLGMISLPLGVFAAGSVYAILKFFELVCNLLLKLPYAYIPVGRPSELVVLLCFGLLFFWMKCRNRKGSWKGAIVLCILLFCAIFENPVFRKETEVTFLDVGQGDAAVIHTWDGKTYLVDGGGQYGKEFGKNVGMTLLLPYLEYLNAGELDGVFLSHPNSDHMIGLLEILDEVSVKGLYLADYSYKVTKEMDFLKEMLEKYPVPVYTLNQKDKSSEDGWNCLAPLAGIRFAEENDNHGSLVLKYTYGGTKVLFTGDMTMENERLLLEQGADLFADILKVSHHGSSYSSHGDFLESVSPKAAVISCGEKNIYGHPHKETLERLKDVDAEVFRTDEMGSILVKLRKNGGFTIETMAERKPLYEDIKEKLEKW